MRYEWGDSKNRSNQCKHQGISFELATLVFEDPHCLVGLDRVDTTGETRWHALGLAFATPGFDAVLFVVHEYWENHDGQEIIRILSARKASTHELLRYREQALE